MTTFQIVSDLHIEISKADLDPADSITPIADVLILAGDIGSLYKMEQLLPFLEKICLMFQAVLYIPGNHEFYTIPDTRPVSYKALEKRLQSLEQSLKNLYILNRGSVRIGDVCIAGCTLWSYPHCTVPPFIVRIPEFNTVTYTARHQKDLKYLEKMIRYCNREKYKLLIVTHHPPSYLALQGAKKKKQFMSLYASDLDHLLDKKNALVWVCGHTHKNIDLVTKKGCRLVSNQKGKPKDNIKDFKKSFEITL